MTRYSVGLKRTMAVACVCAITLCLAGPAFAATAVVVLKDGKELSGEIVSENDSTIMLKIAGISTPIDRSNIKSIKYKLSIKEEYEKRRAKIKDDDITGRYKLASWLVEKDEYELAIKELVDLQKIAKDDGDQRIEVLARVAQSRLKVQREAQAAANQRRNKPAVAKPRDPVKRPAPGAGQVKPEDGVPFEMPTDLLSDEQINLIKVYELEIADKPKVTFKRDDLEDFYAKHGNDLEGIQGRDGKRRFFRMKGYEQLELVFEAQDRGFYSKAIVRGDPPTMTAFRTIHNRYIRNRCATNECHGEGKGNFFLYGPAARIRSAEKLNYTNFYLLATFDNNKGFMIDRSRPEESLLYQYLLPREVARTPHPDVPQFAPMFRDAGDPRAEPLLDWIDSLYKPAPNYAGVNFRIQGLPKPAAPVGDVVEGQPQAAAPGPMIGGN